MRRHSVAQSGGEDYSHRRRVSFSPTMISAVTSPFASTTTTITSAPSSNSTTRSNTNSLVIHGLPPVSLPLPLPFKLTDVDLLRRDCHVHGEWVSSRNNKRFAVLDPGTGRVWAACPDSTRDDLHTIIKSSFSGFQGFSTTPARERARLLTSWHHLILASRIDLATILVHETGKPLNEALAEVDYGAGLVRWFAGEAERLDPASPLPSPAPSPTESLVSSPISDNSAAPTVPTPGTGAFPGKRGAILKQPIGVVLALIPWSFPLALTLRKSAAAMAAGCTVIVKPSSETPLSALALACLADRAGFPPGVLNVLTTSLGNTPVVSESLCMHPLVKAVSFTGSARVGKRVAASCTRNLKRLSLDLGGNCPFLVFEDADLEQTAKDLVALKWRHAGQACVAPNRCYIQRRVYEPFSNLLITETRKLKLGHGMAKDTTLGPVTTIRGLYKAEALCKDAMSKGAVKLLGTGRREPGDGYFMAPTILGDMTDGMLMCREEVFAPVLGLYVFDTENEVVIRANDTPIGLAGYVFTKNQDRLWRIFDRLEAAVVGMNTVSLVMDTPVPAGNNGNGYTPGQATALDEFLITKAAAMPPS
ncbi:Putative aldehyde dehydrogenase domain, aldehyde/histidinol dehydrogenase [Colletotrichum destructivum]|uniref:Aldehyde dehydrogenase domain, aldehyde/histidinol dehydrogenase n=1 Tax=Colletotrichum destructivum TaxID=34406 RepID=A0AAX4I2N2_9PEZI|nr:Putative aldehyde dehydrogenase domain, aldehyde/histidinol dehydrogenase [Colletotrichum destructivum]